MSLGRETFGPRSRPVAEALSVLRRPEAPPAEGPTGKEKKGVTPMSDSLLVLLFAFGGVALFYAAMTWFMRGLHE
jgi:hypothetical protein